MKIVLDTNVVIFWEVFKMCNKEVKIIRPAKKLSAEEKRELIVWLDEMQAWAKSVGLTEKDIEDAIREVRQEKRARRQSA